MSPVRPVHRERRQADLPLRSDEAVRRGLGGGGLGGGGLCSGGLCSGGLCSLDGQTSCYLPGKCRLAPRQEGRVRFRCQTGTSKTTRRRWRCRHATNRVELSAATTPNDSHNETSQQNRHIQQCSRDAASSRLVMSSRFNQSWGHRVGLRPRRPFLRAFHSRRTSVELSDSEGDDTAIRTGDPVGTSRSRSHCSPYVPVILSSDRPARPRFTTTPKMAALQPRCRRWALLMRTSGNRHAGSGGADASGLMVLP